MKSDKLGPDQGTKSLDIWWEGNSYTVSSDNKGYLSFVELCEQLGIKGRDALLQVLATNYHAEVEDAMES